MGSKWTPDEAMRRAAQRSAEAISKSEVFVVMFNEAMIEEVVPLIQMGLCVYMDKPLYLLVPESRVLQIPENVKRLARGMEIFPDNDMREMKLAMERLLAAKEADAQT